MEESRKGYSATYTLATILGLAAVRLVIAAIVPLAEDEAYYWRWSEHLAAGYFDHPPMVAFVIRLGTTFFGDTQFGVRVVSVLLALPAAWAVWRTATILWEDTGIAATAALYFNLTLFVAVGTIIVTPDAPLVCAAAFFAYFLAKLMQTGDGRWWLALGVVGGLGLLSKYTALFWPFTILLMAMLSSDTRRWVLTPYPWLGGVLALLIFSPTLAWNAAHDWMSFRMQFSRLDVPGLHPLFLPEFIGTQIGLATPAIFALGAIGMALRAGGHRTKRKARLLIVALVLPLLAYLVWHSLHTRVEGNWSAPLAPAFVIAAAVATHGEWSGWLRPTVRSLSIIAAPLAVLMIFAIYLQAVTGVFPLGREEPTASKLGAGLRHVAAEVDNLAERQGADAILVGSHQLASWLSFYGQSSLPVLQLGAPYRWTNEPEALDRLAGTFLYVAEKGVAVERLLQGFDHVEYVGEISRTRGNLVIRVYAVYLAGGAHRPPGGSD